MQYFLNSHGSAIIIEIINAIKLNKDYLTKIDGEIGDGDHGINMNKGFSMAGDLIENTKSFSDSAKILSDVLMMEIGGSMGPLYGTLFKRFYKETREVDKITPEIVLKMLESALNGVKEIGNAEVGDKTMIDTLSPAVNGFKDAISKKLSFEDSLSMCVSSAQTGCDSTKEMIARIGRSSRLGDRSRGVLDAGAVSCYIILDSFAKSVKSIIINKQESL